MESKLGSSGLTADKVSTKSISEPAAAGPGHFES